MQLPQTASYALRAVALLAELPPGDSMRAADLADRAQVPPHYMAKVLRRLVSAGLLDVRKGPGGGFLLSRAPARIRFSDVFAAAGVAPDRTCACGDDRCDERDPCRFRPAWAAIAGQFMEWATRTTLADVRFMDVPTASSS